MAKKVTFRNNNNEAVYPKTDASQVLNLAEVARTGSYDDLSNKPIIPSIEGLATTVYVNQQINAAISSNTSSGYYAPMSSLTAVANNLSNRIQNLSTSLNASITSIGIRVNNLSTTLTSVYNKVNNLSTTVTPAVKNYVDSAVTGDPVITKNNFDFSTDFDTLGTGTYAVTNAVNSPFDDENGMLKVVETKSGMFIHTWNGKNNTAFREFGEFNPLEANIDALQVNGVTVNTALSDEYNEQGVKFTYEQKDTENFNSGKIMWVYPGGTYTLSGVLINCQIRVGYMSSWCKKNTTEFQAKTFDAQTDSNATTTIILNNFYHKVDRELVYDSTDEKSWDAAFSAWSPLVMSEIAGKTKRRGKLVIQLADNSKNYIVRECTPTMETVNNKWGVIYSEQDLDITGNGYLGIADGADKDHLLGCHAIKAKGMLKIHNQPHIVGRAYHDLIHGNDSLYVDGGYFQALYCNDILGTDTSLGDQAIGKIRLYNGVFDIRECYGTFVQADDVIVYPGVKVSFKEIGEGLWLQCAPGFYKGEITKKGQVSNFGMVDYTTHEFRLYTPSTKLDAAAFTSLVEETSETSVRVMFNGSEQDIEVSRVTMDMPGIIVYNGVAVTPDAEYIYKESNRNTHVESLVNSATAPDGGWNYNLVFAPTSTETVIENELTVAEAAALLNGHTNDLADADFSAIDYQYSGRASGGIWNIGVTEQKLTEYKNKVDYLFTCVKGMIVPPKEVGVDSVVSAEYDVNNDVYTTDGVENTRTDEFVNNGGEIAAGAVINGQTAISKIKTGASMYTSKTGLEPTINLHVGEAILVNGLLLPADTTNYAMKWSVVGTSEWTVIARLVTEDTMGCYIRALQPGAEDIVISAKALDKDNGKVKITIHFVVEA